MSSAMRRPTSRIASFGVRPASNASARLSHHASALASSVERRKGREGMVTVWALTDASCAKSLLPFFTNRFPTLPSRFRLKYKVCVRSGISIVAPYSLYAAYSATGVPPSPRVAFSSTPAFTTISGVMYRLSSFSSSPDTITPTDANTGRHSSARLRHRAGWPAKTSVRTASARKRLSRCPGARRS